MIESAYSKKTIICSDCPSGPKEFIGKNKGGFLFSSNSMDSLKNHLKIFQNQTEIIFTKKFYMPKKNQNSILLKIILK